MTTISSNLPPKNRRFYSIPTDEEASNRHQKSNEGKAIVSYISQSVIGKNHVFSSPFGQRSVLYLDYTASGRSLSFIEDYIREEVLPEYGNTHTTTSITSLQTTLYRHEARDIIRNAVNASEHDAVIFVGSGCTGAIHKLIHVLNLHQPPVVFVGPYEHHSVLLPWREIGAEVIQIKETMDGLVDIDHLRSQLQKWSNCGRQLIGCFSAASNVTGILSDVDAITACLHQYDALSFWDYATAAPHVKVDMNPLSTSPNKADAHKDAIFMSVHKFVGGVDTPGVLVAKKSLFRSQSPESCGGGSVFFVRSENHRYLQEPELREESGTPAIVGSIRAGMVFQLKEAVGHQTISQLEQRFCRKAMESWETCPSLVILGNKSVPRLPIFSFLIYHEDSRMFLHHNFVSAILNDLFGIQARGGCACAGPYAQNLLGIDEHLAEKYEHLLAEDSRLDRTHLRRYTEYSHREILRPGFTRINLPFFLTVDELDFVIEAVRIIALDGWRLLPKYQFNPETGEWRAKHFQPFKERKWLGHISYGTGCMSYKSPVKPDDQSAPNLQECLSQARQILNDIKLQKMSDLPDQRMMFDEESQPFRWFLMPSEAQQFVKGQAPIMTQSHSLPFCPADLFQSNDDLKVSYPNNDVNKSREVLANIEEQDRNEKSNSSGLKSDSNCLNKLSDTTQSISLNNEDQDAQLLKNDRQNFQTGSSNSKEDDSVAEVCSLTRKTVEGDVQNTSVCLTNKDQSTVNSKPPAVKKIRKSKLLWHRPGKNIFNPFIEAMMEFEMLKSGDRVLVCLSGGKDSLSLLHTIRQYQFYARSKDIHFEFGAVTVDPETPSYDPSPLIGYLAELGVPYFYESQGIMETAQNLPYECASICSFCSRMKRGRLYACARREGYNVLALGQHLDDLVESFLMSFFHNGVLRTMKACYTVEQKDLRVIRPFVFVREKMLRDFAQENSLPVIAENCPACFEAPKERHRIKQLLAAQEILHSRLYHSMMSAMRPIMGIKETGVNIKQLLNGIQSNTAETDNE